MDKYIDQPLAEMQMSEPAQKVVRNILDEPIPETVKGAYLGPYFQENIDLYARLPEDRESKAILGQFDPLPPQKVVRTIQDYQQEILEVFEEEQKKRKVYRTPWAIGNYLRAWQMDVSAEHPLAADPREFLEGVRQRIREKLTEDILALDGVKFQLALKVSLRKQGSDRTEEFTDPMLRHEQKALFQASEIKATFDEPIFHLLSC